MTFSAKLEGRSRFDISILALGTLSSKHSDSENMLMAPASADDESVDVLLHEHVSGSALIATDNSQARRDGLLDHALPARQLAVGAPSARQNDDFVRLELTQGMIERLTSISVP
jgi:hypothetical protein